MSAEAAPPVRLEPSWLAHLEDEFHQPYMQQLRKFLRAEKAAGKIIHPPGADMFNAFARTPLPQVKAVILGQDPYHGPGQAHGLCFSVRPGVALPPSLQNIYKEAASDLNIPMPAHGCLTPWAERGVLLLNSVLSVESGRAASHQGRGWESFTDRVVELVNRECEHVVFMLWGSHARKKGTAIAPNRHCILHAPHPSPLSAGRGFLGCRHFSQANAYLQSHGREPIDWSLPMEAPE